MIKLLLPGLKKTTNTGWHEISSIEEVSASNLDKYMEFKFESETGLKEKFWDKDKDSGFDKRAVHYSIPNPWATAYLFRMIAREGNNSLFEALFMNFLYDMYNGLISLKMLKKPVSSDAGERGFHIFWDLAPDFIKFNNKTSIPLFLMGDKVIGGFSKESIIWLSSENYAAKDQFSPESFKNTWNRSLTENEDYRAIHAILECCKTLNIPRNFDDFWSRNFSNILYESSRIKLDDLSLEEIEILNDSQQAANLSDPNEKKFSNFLKRKKSDPTKVRYYSKTAERFIISDTELKDPDLFGEETDRIRNELLEGKKSLHRSSNKEVILINNYFEEYLIQLSGAEKIYHDDSDNVDLLRHSEYGVFLYPLKEDFFKLNLGTNSYTLEIESGLQSAIALKLTIKEDLNVLFEYRRVYYQDKIFEARNDIGFAVWPPFKSDFSETFIVFQNNKASSDPLTLYDESIKDIAISEQDKISIKIGKFESNLYRLPFGEFPKFLQFSVHPERKRSSGFALIKEKPKSHPGNESIDVAIDFGTSHTVVAFRNEADQFRLLTLELSGPIVFATNFILYVTLLSYFVPEKLLNSPPETKRDYEDSKELTWMPIRTAWWRANKAMGSEINYFLMNGAVPLYYDPEEGFIGENFVLNIKWPDSPESHINRKKFLSSLFRLALVEAEAIGFSRMNVKWSKPPHSADWGFWESGEFKESFNEDVDWNRIEIYKPYLESYASAYYFVNIDRETVFDNYSAIIDIGGGTFDVSILKAQTIIRNDSVKFAGNVLSGFIADDLISALNYIRVNFYSMKEIKREVKLDAIWRVWPSVKDDWSGKLDILTDTLKKEGSLEKVITLIILFFSAIFYYIGLFLKKVNVNVPINQVLLGGNSTNFYHFALRCLERYNLDTPKETIDRLFRSMLLKGQEINSAQRIGIVFSKKPKFEVAQGILKSPALGAGSTAGTTTSLMGACIKLNQNGVKINIDKNSWPEEDKLPTYSQISRISDDDIDLDLFSIFCKTFHNYWKGINNAPILPYPDVDTRRYKRRLKNFLIKNSVVRTKEGKEIERKLDKPLFFVALNVWMESYSPGTETITTTPTKETIKSSQKIIVNISDDGSVREDTGGDFYILLADDKENAELYPGERIMQSKPDSAINRMLEGCFNIDDIGTNKYEIDKCARIKWNNDERRGILQGKGAIWI